MRWPRVTDPEHVRSSERTLNRLDEVAEQLSALLAQVRVEIEAERDDRD